jgi:hypothetical protein
MTNERKPTPVEYLAQYCPSASSAFQSLRKAVVETGPLDPHTCEIDRSRRLRDGAGRSPL